MIREYEIFNSLEDAETKSAKIDVFFNYPNANGTYYRDIFKHISQNLWAGEVNERLKDAIAHLSSSEQLLYFDPGLLKTDQQLFDENWYAPYAQ